jgi:type I restriction enzyme S subunit
MTGRWVTKALGDVCVLDRKQGDHQGLPYVGLEDIQSVTGSFIGPPTPRSMKGSTFLFEPGHVLFGRLRPYLNKTLVPDFRGHCSTELMPLKHCEELDPHYLRYWLSSAATVAEINATSTGARMPRANMDRVMEMELPVPPLSEQKRIVRILDDAFAQIDQARRNTETNLADAEALQGSLLTAQLVKEAGKYPTMPLGKVCEFQGGAQPPKSTFVSKPQPGYVRLLQIRDFGSDDKAVYIPERFAKRSCKATDVMIGRYGASVGQIHRGKSGSYNVALIKTIPDVGLLDPEYFYFYLLSPLFQAPLAGVAQRSAQAGFSKSDINEFAVPVPPLDAQKLIASSISASQSTSRYLLDRYQSRSQLLVTLRFALLKAAFAGELSAGPGEVRLPAEAART